MTAQNYSGEDAYARWRDGGLRRHLKELRRRFRFARFISRTTADVHPAERSVNRLQQLFVLRFGILTWGVFARAFWPIYQKGKSPLFYGSVVLSCAAEDEDAPSLFEVAEQVRVLKDFDVPTKGVEEFARIIRDDYAMQARVPIPEQLSMRSGFFLQSIGIPRRHLPAGYLHHRLVPIVTHPKISYATILPLRFWSEEFTSIWSSGIALLHDQELAQYRADFPEIVP